MESLGEKLKTTRTEKGLSHDQIARETNISIRYLEALESENFSVFPGEPYVLGFLKNYGAYLDLDVQKVISLYRALRIQEQPVPVEQLLRKQTKLPGFLIPLLVILLVLGAGGFGIYQLIIKIRSNSLQNAAAAHEPKRYTLNEEFMNKTPRLYIKDIIEITVDGKLYKLELKNIGETVTIDTPSGEQILELNQEILIDLDPSLERNDQVRIKIVDFVKNNPEMGTGIHFSLLDTAVYTGADIDQNTYSFVSSDAPVSVSSDTTIIPTTSSPYPFTLQMNFQTYCMFRWEILNELNRRGTNQRYFQRGEPLEIAAQNGIRIWTSNAQAARFQVIGGGRTYSVEIGVPGEVAVTEVLWVRDDVNRYRLIVRRLETGN